MLLVSEILKLEDKPVYGIRFSSNIDCLVGGFQLLEKIIQLLIGFLTDDPTEAVQSVFE